MTLTLTDGLAILERPVVVCSEKGEFMAPKTESKAAPKKPSKPIGKAVGKKAVKKK